MEKREKQIAVVLVIILLLLAAFIFAWQGSRSDRTVDPVPEKEPVEKIPIDTLDVTYWNPWGGPTATGGMNIDYVPFTLADYVKGSDIIVLATVSSTTEWNDSSTAGKEKLKELGSPWLYSSNRECYFIVNDVLKGNYDINRVYLKTDMTTPALKSGEKYVLFIDGSENGSYEIRVTEGYLIQNGSTYEGMWHNLSMPEEDLEYLVSFSDKELDWYQRMEGCPQVFIGEMLTSTNDADLIHSGGLESKQPHQVRVISTVKGNLSGVVDFVYDEAYITDEMMQTYLSNEGWPPEAADNMDWLVSTGDAYYNPYHWDPEISPLKAGEVYLICLQEYEGAYHMGASVTDYRLNEHNEKELRKTAEKYRETLDKIGKYIRYGFD